MRERKEYLRDQIDLYEFQRVELNRIFCLLLDKTSAHQRYKSNKYLVSSFISFLQ